MGAVEREPTELNNGHLVVLAARGLSKRFGVVQANNAIDLDLRAGEIHALLGENGAGKSTLLNLLSGVLQPDTGEIAVESRPVQLPSPAEALRFGIGAVHQHFALAPNLTVRENLMLGAGPFILRRDRQGGRLNETLASLGLQDEAETEVHLLAFGARQRVEIAKALYRDARVLLLDEPTALLSPGESRQLFELLHDLQQRGVAIALVTHKLEEALAVSDRITVLRRGQVTGEFTGSARDQERAPDRDQILNAMFGESPSLLPPGPVESVPGRLLLSLRNVSAADERGLFALRNIDLDLHAGEVVGIAGVDGNGQRALAEVIAGQRRSSNGQILLDGEVITNRGVRNALAAGIGYVSDDRLGEGVIAGSSVSENLAIKSIARRSWRDSFWLDRRAITATADNLVLRYDIRTTGVDSLAGGLSGGNMQKLMLARELALQPRVLICNKPTAGLDIRTVESILAMLREAAANGATVLFISPEIEELMAISHRVGILYNGEFVAMLPRSEATPAMINHFMVGGEA